MRVGHELICDPDTLKQSLGRLRREINRLDMVRKRMVKAFGIDEFTYTALDGVIQELFDIEFHFESRIYGDK